MVSAPPSPPALIAFDRTIDGAGRIAIVRADGSSPPRIITTPSGNELPTWSPDGRVLLYVSLTGSDASHADLASTNVATGRTRLLTRTPGLDADPAWSPDGRTIAWTSDRSGLVAIWSMDRDGTRSRRLSTGPSDSQPAWSSDGRRIAFFDRAHGALEVMDANGTHRRRIASPRPSSGPAPPAWSPDGRSIVITAANGALYDISADGSGAHRMTPGAPRMVAWRPRWSPSGRELAFLDIASHGALEVVDLAGRIRTLAARTDGLSAPTWSPGGRTLAYADPAHHITTIAHGGGHRTMLTRAFGDDADPAWQP
jgi:Tol biopolymer transport system component